MNVAAPHIPPLVLDEEQEALEASALPQPVNMYKLRPLNHDPVYPDRNMSRRLLTFNRKVRQKRDPITMEIRVDMPLDPQISATYRRATKHSSRSQEGESESININTDRQRCSTPDSAERNDGDALADSASAPYSSRRKEVSDGSQKAQLQDLYIRACHQYNVLPKRYVLENVTETQLVLRGKNVDDGDMRAIGVMLLNNANVEKLDFGECSLHNEGACAVAELLNENPYITELSLANNAFSTDGLRGVCSALKQQKYIRRLDLSGLHLRDGDALIIEQLLQSNTSITSLKLSNNDFSVEGGIALARALLDNQVLEVLDLSWNHLRGNGAVAIANSLKKNSALRKLDVSMNGFGEEGCSALASALVRNRTLEELNLSKNRIVDKHLRLLYAGLSTTSLKKLDLSGNVITPIGALHFVRFLLKQTAACELRSVNFREITVDTLFIELMQRLKEERGITLDCEPAIRKAFDKRYEADPIFMQANPVKILLAFMKRKNLRTTELFQTFTSADASENQGASKDHISRDAFVRGLQVIQVPLTNFQVDELVRMLDTDNDGLVSIQDLKNMVKEYNQKEIQRERRRAERLKMERLQAPKSAVELKNDFLLKGIGKLAPNSAKAATFRSQSKSTS